MSMNKRGRVRPTHEWDLLVPLFEWPELLWAPALLLALIHRSAWNRNSAKFGVLREEREAEASPSSLVETRLV